MTKSTKSKNIKFVFLIVLNVCTVIISVINFLFMLMGYNDSALAFLFTLTFILISVLFLIKSDLIFTIPYVIYWIAVLPCGIYNTMCEFKVIKYKDILANILISSPVGGLTIFPSLGIPQIIVSVFMLAIPVVKLIRYLKSRKESEVKVA